ncbi:MAG: DUF1759 domain-containing protein, partial [Candidatus Thiodiazotropha taylori]|nr:DUF1759 domain-containing protein [Candidatus Thiodiazotropha taylori]MCW4335706.1 DUF1759 domain-containing protein [Candidatus Thiodiazotropha endolucinida]
INNTASQHSISSEVSYPTVSSASQLRLPKLTLPSFSGSILEWPTFWDSFESSIHLNSALPDIQKFSYLKSLTQDAAARAIDGFPLTNANYTKAIELLRERFGQPHKIINAYMQALLEMPRPSKTLQSLQTFYDNLETYIRGLESLGQSQDSYGSLLVPIVIDKLPPEVRSNMTRNNGSSNWTMDSLRMALKNEINILQAGYRTEPPDAPSSTVSFLAGTKTGATHPYLRETKPASDRRSQEKKCQFCGDKHLANDCKKVTAVSARKEIVKQNHLCFNCLGNHLVSSCRSNNRCRTCHKKHHSSICDRQLNPQGQSTLNAAASNFVPAGSRHLDEPIIIDRSTPDSSQGGQSAILHSTTQQSHSTLLKTAIAQISSQQCCSDANILFDEGSQRSFVTEDMANKIQLERNGIEEVHIASFGAATQNVRHFDTATVWLHTDNGEKIPINVLVVPTIAVPLCNLQKAVSSLPYLQSLKHAHPATDLDFFEIELLIGADHYWKIVQNRVIRGNGPTAVQSKIGYLLSGPLPMQSNQSNASIFNVIAATHPQGELYDLQRFWKLESIGISTPKDESPVASHLQEYQETCIEFKDGRYSAKLPWKEDHPPLPDNYSVALRRTQNTIRRLQEGPAMFQKYGEIIADQERRGFIEKVDLAQPAQNVHYIPHRGVTKESTTTPIRIVYDCSCRQSRDAPSLNDCLKSMPPELNDLTGILIRFR